MKPVDPHGKIIMKKMDLEPKDAELVVAIVARIGVDTKTVMASISNELRKYRYEVYEIHLTDFLKAFAANFQLIETPVEERYSSYITACNRFRADAGNDIMANIAIMDVVSKRKTEVNTNSAQKRNAFLINQIKRPEECERLRKVYGEHYVQISCHANEDVRIERLTSRISRDHPEDPKSTDWDIKARKLVHMDESQEDEKNGQRVRQVFPLSDVIIDADTPVGSEVGIERFFRAFFGDKSVTPTREEYGMELANTAALRSSDLSRQVGAAILTPMMEIQALGCNEVPRAKGGTYWEGDKHDGRDFTFGHDSNEQRKRAVIIDLMLRLNKANALKSDLGTHAQIEKFLFSRDDKIIADSQLMDSLEYGRSVHAEMNAITDAARGGHAIKDCILFSNTFPCHNCAKHIVASGISEVVYIHPYPKSYAKELFADSIVVNPRTKSDDRVVFRQFKGIVGPMYARVFTKVRWKKEGGIVDKFEKRNASYVRRTPIPAYLQVEELLLDEMNHLLREAGYLPLPPSGASHSTFDPDLSED